MKMERSLVNVTLGIRGMDFFAKVYTLKLSQYANFVKGYVHICVWTPFTALVTIQPRISNSDQDIIIISSIVGAVAFLLFIVLVVVMLCICYHIRKSSKKKSDLYVIVYRLIQIEKYISPPLLPFSSPSLLASPSCYNNLIIHYYIQCWSQKSKQAWWM